MLKRKCKVWQNNAAKHTLHQWAEFPQLDIKSICVVIIHGCFRAGFFFFFSFNKTKTCMASFNALITFESHQTLKAFTITRLICIMATLLHLLLNHWKRSVSDLMLTLSYRNCFPDSFDGFSFAFSEIYSIYTFLKKIYIYQRRAAFKKANVPSETEIKQMSCE